MYSSAHGEPKDRCLDWASVQECLLDGPARAVRCGRAIIGAVLPLGLDVREGVHTGEVEVINEKVGGLAVNIGARVAALAESRELLVSSTVKDLTAG